MTLFWMETPKRATNPTSAATERFRRASGNASKPPAAANGTVNNTKAASRPESKATKRRKKMARMVSGTITARRRSARFSFSNEPVHSRR